MRKSIIVVKIKQFCHREEKKRKGKVRKEEDCSNPLSVVFVLFHMYEYGGEKGKQR
jgi:hypothetical protein